jgi:phosphatidylglycerophosphatase A
VIDEVSGQWIALLPLSGGLWFAGVDPWLFT